MALTAGLAVTCFAKVFAMGFLGMPRSEGAARAAEARMGTRAPLALLAVCCVLLGILPTYVIPVSTGRSSPLYAPKRRDGSGAAVLHAGAPGAQASAAGFRRRIP